MRYLLAFYGDETQWDDASPAETQAGIDAFWRFEAELMEAGVHVACDGLDASASAKTIEIRGGGEKLVTDGPFAETKEQLGGITLLECDTLDEAMEWARKVPLGEGWTIEVRPVTDYGSPPEGHPAGTAEAAAS
ncbi:MAG TPA: YciI family protein [Solirubrobacterales bacterium]